LSSSPSRFLWLRLSYESGSREPKRLDPSERLLESGGDDAVRLRSGAWALLALTVALIVGTAFLVVVNQSLRVTTGEWGTSNIVYPIVLSATAFSVVGGLITMRRPGHTLGWLCLAIGFSLVLTVFTGEYARYSLITSPGSLPGGRVAGWFDNWSFFTFVGPVGTILPLWFPDGRLPSPRWRPALAFSFVAVALGMASSAFIPGPLANFPRVQNPFGIRGAEWLEAGYSLFPIAFLVASASVVFRFHRARGDERQQIKWFAFASSILAATVFFVNLDLLPGRAARVSQDIVGYMSIGLPLAIGIAILKYRLYDIDRIINRTLVYAGVSVVLGLGYYALIILLPLVVSGDEARRSPVIVAATTLAIAALFRPVRTRVQELIDRRFNRRKYDAARTIDAFSGRLREEIDLDALTVHLLDVVHDTMEPRHASLWLRTLDAPARRGHDE
jgi:hypothetical protein